MRFRKSIVAAATALLAAGTIAGCSSGSSSSGGSGGGDNIWSSGQVDVANAQTKIYDELKGKKIAFVPLLFKGYALAENWGTTFERTFTPAGADYKVYDANFSPDRMVQTMNDLIARKAADVIIVMNQAQGLLDNAVEKAAKAGIYVVVINQMTTKLGDVFVGPDLYKAGKAMAERAMTDCQARPDAKQVAVLDGNGTDPASVLWNKSIKDTMEPKGFKVDVTHTLYQNPAAQKAAESALSQHQNRLCAIMPLYDVNAVTVGQSVKTSASRGGGGDVGVYTLDANSQTCDAIKDGTIRATSAYDVQGIGAAAAIAVQNLLAGGEKPGADHKFGLATTFPVDRNNVDTTTIACYHSK
ncbi:sugar ABC transporter substrate-binding protein [Gordonia sp. (in: high G+C Gram-positive bacteria)]|uniref:sugar ABC transporter substrate-binding protein n=1 Tax=Gordonia sp. (in: high G+C Gram-positive bacteria) TaxID=84139 RepID=UPI0039E38238